MQQDISALLKKIRKIEIKSRKLTQHVFSGEYHSAFKGKGMSFSEVREYQYGDDIRNIEWNVTARYNHPYVKVFEEERELTVLLLIDISASTYFGTHQQTKRELITEIAAVLSFSAITNNDKVGAIFFTNHIEKYIPPKKGKTHMLRIIRELLTIEPQSAQTSITAATTFLMNAIKKRAIVFLISDFIDEQYELSLRIVARKHDLIALKITDPREESFSNIGTVPLFDPETQTTYWVNTSCEKTLIGFKACAVEQNTRIKEVFQRNGIDHAFLYTYKNYIPALSQLFKQRILS